jgi:uncharacterized protein (TIGR02246 family)
VSLAVSASDEQQIRELVATWLTATRQGDVAAVLNLMTDDVVFLVAGQPPFGKREFAAAMRPPAEGGSRPQVDGRSEIEEIAVSGDMAYLRTKLTVEVTPPGSAESTRRAGNTLTILRRENGRWLLARDANLLAPIKT